MAVTRRRSRSSPCAAACAKKPQRRSNGLVRALFDHFTDREHGTKANQVPAAWRQHRGLCSLYALSSFAYCIFGVFFFFAIPAHRRFYEREALEGLFFVWQGFISFQCDAVDLGVPSISHPIDRFSACAFMAWQFGKYVLCAARGLLGARALATFPLGVVAGLYAFWRSARAVDLSDREAYFRWHTIWHFAFPIANLVHYGGHWRLF
jgi:hypothetical protein